METDMAESKARSRKKNQRKKKREL